MKQSDVNDEINEFDSEPASTLKRVPAPAGFADSVMARVALEPKRTDKLLAWPRPQTLVWGALAAILLCGAAGVGEWQHQRELTRQADAERQFSAAMVATGRALDLTQRQLSRTGMRLAD